MKKVVLVTALASVVLADTTIQGPGLGYLSSGAGIRRVLGIVGASRLSAPLTSELANPLVLPGTDFAAGTNAAGELLRIDLRDGSALVLGASSVGAMAASPSGEALVAVVGETLQIISREGKRVAEFPIAGNPLLVAVADRDKTAAITVAEPDGEALYLFNDQGGRRVFRASKIAALAFVPKSGDLIAADGSGAIYRLNADLQLLQVTTVEGTVALAGTADGSRLLAVAGQTIHAVAFGTGETSSVECPCIGTVAMPLSSSTFLLTSGDDGPMWIVDTSGSLRVAFIPESSHE